MDCTLREALGDQINYSHYSYFSIECAAKREKSVITYTFLI
ncbi:protein of unknown function [Vibrio tapetis subsp. tapetis]|uniref:Uncharacterized protein n=1 Tax=Vibrio tapetis subsp. tapetis TaxID=1671868 RepID=A0A2N8ZME7_9VIBR|nr:protein of unknown function [Vibrio tapetis subsp. tapetis]